MEDEAKVIGGCLFFVVYVAVSLGWGLRTRIYVGWTNGMIKINGGSN